MLCSLRAYDTYQSYETVLSWWITMDSNLNGQTPIDYFKENEYNRKQLLQYILTLR